MKKPVNKDAPIPAAIKGKENNKTDLENQASATKPADQSHVEEKVKDDES